MSFGTGQARLDSFDDVIRQLGLRGQWSVGLRTIPTAAIIGSVDRPGGFDRGFRPRTRTSGARLRGLRRAFPDGDFPPISVYQVGNAYFVSDGHHRVALANMMGMCYMDADIVRVRTAKTPAFEPRPSRRCRPRVPVRNRLAALIGRPAEPARLGSSA